MRLAASRARVEALAAGALGSSSASLVRALNKKEVRRCSKAWDAFARNCSGETPRRNLTLRQLPPSDCLPPGGVNTRWALPQLDARVQLEVSVAAGGDHRLALRKKVSAQAHALVFWRDEQMDELVTAD